MVKVKVEAKSKNKLRTILQVHGEELNEVSVNDTLPIPMVSVTV